MHDLGIHEIYMSGDCHGQMQTGEPSSAQERATKAWEGKDRSGNSVEVLTSVLRQQVRAKAEVEMQRSAI